MTEAARVFQTAQDAQTEIDRLVDQIEQGKEVGWEEAEAIAIAEQWGLSVEELQAQIKLAREVAEAEAQRRAKPVVAPSPPKPEEIAPPSAPEVVEGPSAPAGDARLLSFLKKPEKPVEEKPLPKVLQDIVKGARPKPDPDPDPEIPALNPPDEPEEEEEEEEEPLREAASDRKLVPVTVPQLPKDLLDLNDKHAVISNLGGKCVVMEWVPSSIVPGSEELEYKPSQRSENAISTDISIQ
jgi:hypothetical protein